MRIAFIDFDGTAIKGDSIIFFIKYLYSRKKINLIKGLCAIFYLVQYLIGYIDEKRAKEKTLDLLRKYTIEEIDKISKDFVNEILKPKIFNEMHELIVDYSKKGYKIVFVSASPDIYMKHIKDIVYLDDIICTIVYKTDGHYKIYGQNCKGDEKVIRIREYLHDKYPDVNLLDCAGFGDSKSDKAMLDIMGYKCFVNNFRLYNKYVQEKKYDLKYWLN